MCRLKTGFRCRDLYYFYLLKFKSLAYLSACLDFSNAIFLSNDYEELKMSCPDMVSSKCIDKNLRTQLDSTPPYLKIKLFTVYPIEL